MKIFGFTYFRGPKKHKQGFGILYHIDQLEQKRYGTKLAIYVMLALAVLLATIMTVAIIALKDKPAYKSCSPDEVVCTNEGTISLISDDAVLPDPCAIQDIYCDGEPIPVTGNASFLDYKINDTCATRDWPKQTRLEVSANGKTIVCVVRDFGPSKAKHPDRIIDLNRDQFAQLESTRRGVVEVTVKPL